MNFIIICQDGSTEETKGGYVLATRQVFSDKAEADRFAATISPSREPLVVEGLFNQLRFPWMVQPES